MRLWACGPRWQDTWLTLQLLKNKKILKSQDKSTKQEKKRKEKKKKRETTSQVVNHRFHPYLEKKKKANEERELNNHCLTLSARY